MFKYFKNSYNELVHKVTWPSLEQLIGSTKVVLVASVIFALVVLVMDKAFDSIMNGVYNLLG
jgi:preprotein translocase subunit SecE